MFDYGDQQFVLGEGYLYLVMSIKGYFDDQ